MRSEFFTSGSRNSPSAQDTEIKPPSAGKLRASAATLRPRLEVSPMIRIARLSMFMSPQWFAQIRASGRDSFATLMPDILENCDRWNDRVADRIPAALDGAMATRSGQSGYLGPQVV